MAHFTWAIGNGNPYEALYHLGLMHAKAARQENPLVGKKTGTCGVAVSYLKSMVERGSWKYDMIGQADAAWKRGDRVTALIRWWVAAEMGYEVAQNNVAFLLEQGEARCARWQLSLSADTANVLPLQCIASRNESPGSPDQHTCSRRRTRPRSHRIQRCLPLSIGSVRQVNRTSTRWSRLEIFTVSLGRSC
jgi:hypothetical protein